MVSNMRTLTKYARASRGMYFTKEFCCFENMPIVIFDSGSRLLCEFGLCVAE